MANIKKLQMWTTICSDSRIGVSTSFFGFKTTATYLPTNSIIDAYTKEYSPQNGDRLKHILLSPHSKLEDAVGDFHPEEIPNGNYLVEVCQSRDRQFAALLLLQYNRLCYEPVTEVIIFEDMEADIICRLFQ